MIADIINGKLHETGFRLAPAADFFLTDQCGL